MDVSMWGIITVFPDSRCITPQGKLSTSIKYNYITYIVKVYISMPLYLYLVVILTILTCQYRGAYCVWCMGVNKFKCFSHSPVHQYPTTPSNQLSLRVHFILTPNFLEQRTLAQIMQSPILKQFNPHPHSKHQMDWLTPCSQVLVKKLSHWTLQWIYILWNLKGHYCVPNSKLLNTMSHQANKIPTLINYFFKIHFNIIL